MQKIEIVTYYLDTLVFGMVTTLESFEPIVSINKLGSNEKILTIMRFYINMPRAGLLAGTNTTKVLLGAMLNTGWVIFCINQQQGGCKLFTFITDKFEMTIVTLTLRIEHEGKEVATEWPQACGRTIAICIGTSYRDQ